MTALRLTLHGRGRPVRFRVNETELSACEGETLAAVLLAADRLHLRDSPRGGPRGAFCLMGVCQECLLQVDGVQRLACLVTVSDGMQVTL